MFECVFSRLDLCVRILKDLCAQQTLASEDEIARSYLEGASLDEVFAQIDDAEASAVKKAAYKKPGLHVRRQERSKACRFLREKPSQGNLWLLIRKVSWQRRLPTFSERTCSLPRKIEFTAVKSFVWRCQFIDFVPHELFIIYKCSMFYAFEKSPQENSGSLQFSVARFVLAGASDLPIAIEVRTYQSQHDARDGEGNMGDML